MKVLWMDGWVGGGREGRCGGIKLAPAEWILGQEEAGGASAISNCSFPTSHTVSLSFLMHADSLELDIHEAGAARSDT